MREYPPPSPSSSPPSIDSSPVSRTAGLSLSPLAHPLSFPPPQLGPSAALSIDLIFQFSAFPTKTDETDKTDNAGVSQGAARESRTVEGELADVGRRR